MSGISGGTPRDLTDAQDAFFQRQIERIRAEERTGVKPAPARRRPRTGAGAKARHERDEDANKRADA